MKARGYELLRRNQKSNQNSKNTCKNSKIRLFTQNLKMILTRKYWLLSKVKDSLRGLRPSSAAPALTHRRQRLTPPLLCFGPSSRGRLRPRHCSIINGTAGRAIERPLCFFLDACQASHVFDLFHCRWFVVVGTFKGQKVVPHHGCRWASLHLAFQVSRLLLLHCLQVDELPTKITSASPSLSFNYYES